MECCSQLQWCKKWIADHDSKLGWGYDDTLNSVLKMITDWDMRFIELVLRENLRLEWAMKENRMSDYRDLDWEMFTGQCFKKKNLMKYMSKEIAIEW